MGRVYLRRPEAADGREFLAAARASVGLHRPWVFPTATQAGFVEYLARIEDDRQEGFLVCRRGDDRLVGVVNLSEIVRGAFCSAYVGYWGVAGVCGGGLMTEGLARVVDVAFGELELHRLEANVQPGNERSLRLVRRLGMRMEGFSPRYLKIDGEWRDHDRWALTSEEWAGAEVLLERLGRA